MAPRLFKLCLPRSAIVSPSVSHAGAYSRLREDHCVTWNYLVSSDIYYEHRDGGSVRLVSLKTACNVARWQFQSSRKCSTCHRTKNNCIDVIHCSELTPLTRVTKFSYLVLQECVYRSRGYSPFPPIISPNRNFRVPSHQHLWRGCHRQLVRGFLIQITYRTLSWFPRPGPTNL